MGLIDFIKDAGAYLFGSHAGTAVAATKADPVTVEILQKQVESVGIPVQNLYLAFNDPVATVSGTVATPDDRQKIVLAVGNTPGVGKVDDMLVAQLAPAAAADVPAAEVAMETYTVQKGDTLSAISKSVYGNANKYQKIFEANTPMLKNPDRIYPGQVLRIPPLQ
jgi:nucleoid-associated protein YgaU